MTERSAPPVASGFSAQPCGLPIRRDDECPVCQAMALLDPYCVLGPAGLSV